MQGIVQSGGTDGNVLPISGARVTLYEATEGSPTILGQATSDGIGAFTINTTKIGTNSTFYATAEMTSGVVLMVLIGANMPSGITINELTTVAAVYCTAQFLQDGQIRGNAFGILGAARMSVNLVYADDGVSSPVLLSSPNGDETNALRSTRSLANLLVPCVRNAPDGCQPLLDLATPPNGQRPKDTIAAMLNIARYPANNVDALFTQSKVRELYQPALERKPDAWTLAVKVNDSGDDKNMFGGPANLVFDKLGRAWISNNVVQGTPNSSAYCMVLDRDGTPATNSKGKKMSPFTGGGLWGAGFGVDLDADGNVWIGNFGWGGEAYDPTGSVSKFNSETDALSPQPGAPEAGGYTNKLHKVQQTVVDRDGNVWMSSYGNNSVVVYPGGNEAAAIAFESGNDKTFLPFGLALAADGTAWVTNSEIANSGIDHFEIVDGAVKRIGEPTRAGANNKGIVIDSQGTIWVASGADDFVYAFTPEGKLIGSFNGGGVKGPWGVALDGDDNVWVANFGPIHAGSIFDGRLTVLTGAKGTKLGEPISPPSGYTLHTAGDPALLHDGTPLYAGDGPECFIPMMRTTAVRVDASGNVWTCNNWKPNFNIDIDTNPGGDGMVIFIGLAKPV
jgi:hypothetical protein